MYTSTYDQMERRFDTSREVATVGLTTFVLGLAIGPMLLAPLSEVCIVVKRIMLRREADKIRSKFYGRRPVYIGSFLLFLIWLIPCAVAQNIATEIIGRFFDGLVGRQVV